LSDFNGVILFGWILATLAKENPYYKFHQFQKWAFQSSPTRSET